MQICFDHRLRVGQTTYNSRQYCYKTKEMSSFKARSCLAPKPDVNIECEKQTYNLIHLLCSITICGNVEQ